MPIIPEYTSPRENLTPSPLGASAWETAGRRLGPLYNEKAQFQKAQGATLAAEYKDMLWPLNILKLYEARKAEAATKAPGGISFKVREPSAQDHHQISRGMGALGQIAAQDTVGYGSGFEDRSLFGRPMSDIDAQAAADLAAQKQAQRAIDAYNNRLFDAQQKAAAADVAKYNEEANKWANAGAYEGYPGTSGGGAKDVSGQITDYGSGFAPAPALPYDADPYTYQRRPGEPATGFIPTIIQGLQNAFAPAAIAEGSQSVEGGGAFSGGAGGY